ncbi:MAG: hypothetical protein HY653_06850, partial [Acidobacteria bacterium]|nr:hypothetical protein [Acidobacteriota bacterium]
MPEVGPEKRILFAFVLSFLVLALWSYWAQKKYAPRPPAPAAAPAPAPITTTTAPLPPAVEPVETPPARPA